MTIKQYAYTVGQATVTRIQELTLANITPAALFPDWDAGVLADHPDWLPSEAMDESREHILLSVHSWLIQESGRTILIDTGAGNGKKRPYAPYFDGLNNPFLERLRAVGVAPEDIDYVLLTHLHVDHVGWNTRLQGGSWVPTFPKARYIFSRAEHAYFTDPQNQTARNRTTFQVQKDSVVSEVILQIMAGPNVARDIVLVPRHGSARRVFHSKITFSTDKVPGVRIEDHHAFHLYEALIAGQC
jgi:hypothetical protein